MTPIRSMTKYLATHLRSFHKRGLKRTSFEKRLLGLFFTNKNKKLKPPKKENLRCKIIRGHKKLIRQFQKSTTPIRNLNKCDLSISQSAELWDVMQNHYFINKNELDDISRTENGPKTDGKTKRGLGRKGIQNSYNLLFCKEYFKSSVVKQSFFYYVQFLFSYLEPELLCEKFDLRCCRYEHDRKCAEKWLLLKKYFTNYMIEDLETTPYVPSQDENYLPILVDLQNTPVEGL
ncbi:unnamed protein product [Blepharisma stoltei]|uniref:Uncharacterized protein n=1 Tax=Blepharisma stoltei TaxID=1481888 RepID=A0AAU9K964_9CILI|nr:unnamed protein product [Blepharisma stoltei]